MHPLEARMDCRKKPEIAMSPHLKSWSDSEGQRPLAVLDFIATLNKNISRELTLLHLKY